MYISIGGEIVIKSKDLIAILDQHIINESEIMRNFLQKTAENTAEATKDTYKSIVITTDKVYFSPLSSTTLIKRSY
ncbi:MAG: extracellular matrix regulator RemB [Bacillus sp. (in: firmicutes)]